MIDLIVHLRWGEQPWLPPGDLAFGFPWASIHAVPARTGRVVDLPPWQTLVLCVFLVSS